MVYIIGSLSVPILQFDDSDFSLTSDETHVWSYNWQLNFVDTTNTLW